ncbi:MAG: hypothetical protein MJA30_13365, partial [Cytophagales bacterium]|nr:hypothetical protein [Cytophagales bacterium]
TDTLFIIEDGGAPLIPDITNIENVFINAFGFGDTVVNFQNSSGVEQIWNDRSVNDVFAVNIQDDVTLGVRETYSYFESFFSPGAITDGGLDMVFQDAGAIGDPRQDNFVNLNGNTVDTLTIWSNGSSPVGNNVGIRIYDNGGVLTDLHILGTQDLFLDLDEGFSNSGFENITDVDATGMTGFLDLNLVELNTDVTFNGGAGGTVVELGNGNNTITTMDGDDEIQVESGNTTIDAGGGDDVVGVGGGNGVSSILLGDGDDVLDLSNSILDGNDSIDGGAGFDSLELNMVNAHNASQSDAVDMIMDGFERLIVNGDASSLPNQTAVIDFDLLGD